MNRLEALLLGIVQGLTEFLPVSSSGHLVMAQEILGTESEGILFEIAVHVATLVAIVIFYRRRIGTLLWGAVRADTDAWRYGLKLAVGTLPAVILVVLAKPFMEAQFEAPAITGVALILTGELLWWTRHTAPTARAPEPSWAGALLIGCAQAFAILPGISRSGVTLVAALGLGVEPLAAAEFSFLLGVIAITGAAVMTLADLSAVPPGLWSSVIIGGSAALVSGLMAIWLFLRLLRGQRFYRFAYYCWTVGAVFLLWLWLRT